MLRRLWAGIPADELPQLRIRAVFPEYEFNRRRPLTDPALQVLSSVWLARDATSEPDALAFAEVQFPLPHLQYLDEARG